MFTIGVANLLVDLLYALFTTNAGGTFVCYRGVKCPYGGACVVVRAFKSRVSPGRKDDGATRTALRVVA